MPRATSASAIALNGEHEPLNSTADDMLTHWYTAAMSVLTLEIAGKQNLNGRDQPLGTAPSAISMHPHVREAGFR
jgi:hypothetical protein